MKDFADASRWCQVVFYLTRGDMSNSPSFIPSIHHLQASADFNYSTISSLSLQPFNLITASSSAPPSSSGKTPHRGRCGNHSNTVAVAAPSANWSNYKMAQLWYQLFPSPLPLPGHSIFLSSTSNPFTDPSLRLLLSLPFHQPFWGSPSSKLLCRVTQAFLGPGFLSYYTEHYIVIPPCCCGV